MAAADASGTIVAPRFDVTNFVAEFSNFKLEGLQLGLRGGTKDLRVWSHRVPRLGKKPHSIVYRIGL